MAIAKRQSNGLQNVVYSSHKHKQSLKYQEISTSDGMFLHIFVPLEYRRHDWTLYSRNGDDGQLQQTLNVNMTIYCVYGDFGYNVMDYLCIPFQATVSEDQSKLKEAMSRPRVAVERMFKELRLYWKAVYFKKKVKVGDVHIGAL